MKKLCIDLSAMNPLYKGGVNTYIYGILSGFKKIKSNKYLFNIVCTQENYNSLKVYKTENLKIIKVKSPNKIYSYFLKLTVLLNLNFFYIIFNNLKWKKITECCDNNGDCVYVPTTILNGFNGKKPRILSIHDIQHKHYPENFRYFELKSRKFAYDLSVKYSHSIQASSQFIKKDIIKHYNFFNKKRIQVIKEGIDLNKFKIKKNFKSKIRLPKKYLFYPAQMWPHKDHITVLKAFNKLNKNYNFHLILTGAKLSAYGQILNFITSNNLKNRVHILGVVSLNDLINIYSKSFSVISAAKYESSSLPILEAASIGVPIIAANTKPNLELQKYLSINFFKVANSNSLKQSIIDIKKNPFRIIKMVKFNKKNIKKFDWKYNAEDLLKYFFYSNNAK